MKELVNGNKEIKIEINLLVKKEDVDDIICTAFYGGITYWCPKVTKADGSRTKSDMDASTYLWEGGELSFWEDEDDTGENLVEHKVNLEKFINAIKMYIEGGYRYSASIMDTDGDSMILECGNVDDEVADCIVQLACFGEVVYG